MILQSWAGFEAYTIARLPQLERLDGKEITRTDRIKALQRLPALCKEIPLLAQEVTSFATAICRLRSRGEIDPGGVNFVAAMCRSSREGRRFAQQVASFGSNNVPCFTLRGAGVLIAGKG